MEERIQIQIIQMMPSFQSALHYDFQDVYKGSGQKKALSQCEKCLGVKTAHASVISGHLRFR